PAPDLHGRERARLRPAQRPQVGAAAPRAVRRLPVRSPGPVRGFAVSGPVRRARRRPEGALRLALHVPAAGRARAPAPPATRRPVAKPRTAPAPSAAARPPRPSAPAAAARARCDARHGEDLLARVPTTPGVYRWVADDGTVLYVGKAKNLRRRLAQ